MSNENIHEIIFQNENPERIDKFLSSKYQKFSRTKISKLLTTNKILVNDKEVKKSYILEIGDIIKIDISDDDEIDIQAENIPIEILYEDAYLLVVNKPAGMVVHPAVGNYSGTLVNALMYKIKNLSNYNQNLYRPGIVHRLDKGTSGLLIIAKDNYTHSLLNEMFQKRLVNKFYKAIVWGNFNENEGKIIAPIGRSERDRKLMTIKETGKYAETLWKIVEEFDFVSLLELKLITGRTHQIRVHLNHINKFIFGDETYGLKSVKQLPQSLRKKYENLFNVIKRPALHSEKLEFEHPILKTKLEIKSLLPPDFENLLKKIKNKR